MPDNNEELDELERAYREMEEARAEELYGEEGPGFFARVGDFGESEAERELREDVPSRIGLEGVTKEPGFRERFGESAEERRLRAEEPEKIEEARLAWGKKEKKVVKVVAKAPFRAARWLGEAEEERRAPRIFRPITGPAKYFAEREELGRRGRPRRGEPRGVTIARRISGAFASGLSREERQALYFGRAGLDLYRTKPRETMPLAGRAVPIGTSPASQALAPGWSPAAQALIPGYAGLRELTMPRGLSPAEQSVMKEVHANGDSDTPKHIVSELGQEGISPTEAQQAVRRLAAAGYIKPTGEIVDNQSVLEVHPSLLR